MILTGLEIFERELGALQAVVSHFSKHCGGQIAKLATREHLKPTWAGLEPVDDNMSLSDFLWTFSTNATRRQWYCGVR